MIDISLLRVLKTREGFDKLYKNIPLRSLEQRTQIIIKDIAKYYSKFTEHTEVDYIQFKDMFFGYWHKGLDEESTAFYHKILDRADKKHDEVSQKVIMNALLEVALADKVMHLVEEYNDGEDMDIVSSIATLVKDTEDARERKSIDSFVDLADELDDIMEAEENGTGLHYRNPALESSLKPAQFGDDFLVVAARPNQGKTTFILNEVTHMVGQVDERPVLWLNNEGRRERIVKRCMQVALGLKMSEMIKLHQNGKLISAYEEAIQAEHNAIKVKDIHGYQSYEVEDLIATVNPKIVVFDMIDHVKFPGMSDARTDQVLEEMYKWARELGVISNLMPIATSQVSVEGAEMPYPAQGMLKDSKTGKQGAADTLMMLGHSGDPLLVNSRFVSTPKTKSKKEGASLPRQEFTFDIDRGRFV